MSKGINIGGVQIEQGEWKEGGTFVTSGEQARQMGLKGPEVRSVKVLLARGCAVRVIGDPKKDDTVHITYEKG